MQETKKAGRPRIHDYDEIVKLYQKYRSKTRVAREMEIDKKIVYRALEANARKLAGLPVDNSDDKG